MKEFVSLQGIIEIYCISRKLVRNILRLYRVDYNKKEDDIYINIKEFHKIYTSEYNPALFVIEEKKDEEEKNIMENTINRTFFNIFSEPVDYKRKLKRMNVAYVSAR